MKFQDFKTRLMEFCKAEILPKTKSDLTRFIINGAIGKLDKSMPMWTQKIAPTLSFLGILEGDDEINLENLDRFFDAAFDAQSEYNFWVLEKVNREDVAALVRYLRK